MALAFLQNLNAVLEDTLGKKVKGLIPDLTRGLLRAGPVMGQAISLASGQPWAALFAPSADYAKSFFPEGKTVEKTFKALSDALDGSDKRYLVIIDDIDRLNPDEAVAIFRLVKSIGRLPNVVYLLVFDRALADKAVAERYPSEGPHFLEKIVQASFELPNPLQDDLNRSLLAGVQRICGEVPDRQSVRLMNLYFDIVVPFMATPRHVVRLENALSVTWPSVAGEVDLADFLALEALRLYEPTLYQAIKANKQSLCGTRQHGDIGGNNDARFNPFIAGAPPERQEVAKRALLRLFPRMERAFYADGFLGQWDQDRLVCIERHFDTYFRLTLNEGRISQSQVEELIQRADDREFVQTQLRRAAAQERPNGESMVPAFLGELTTHASRISSDKVEPLLSALFEIHDEIELERDQSRGFGSMGGTTMRYHWLIRALTRDRLSLEGRSQLYLNALRSAAPGWLADFTRSAYADYHPEGNRQVSPVTCLVLEDVVPELVGRTLDSFRSAAADGTLLRRRDMRYDLHLWKVFAGDAAEPRAWTDALLADDAAIPHLARAFTSESWSFGMGFDGLGDRVSRRNTEAAIKPDTDVIDFPRFRARLEELSQNERLAQDDLASVKTLLEALNRPQRRRPGTEDDDDEGDDL